MFYIRSADRLVRTAPWVDSFEGGIEVGGGLGACHRCRTDCRPPFSTRQKLKRIIIKDELGICADLDREMAFLVGTYEDEWKQAVTDPELRKQFRQFVNTVRPVSLALHSSLGAELTPPLHLHRRRTSAALPSNPLSNEDNNDRPIGPRLSLPSSSTSKTL